MLLIKNATVLTMEDEGILRGADVLCENGKVKEIGQKLSAEGAQVLDATGLYVTPGLVESHCHFGGMGLSGSFLDPLPDLNEVSGAVNPGLDARYAIDIDSPDFKQLHVSGITSACLIPGSANVIGGRGFVAKTAGQSSIRKLTLRFPVALKCAMGGNPKSYGKRGLPPMTRMGVADMLRNALRAAKEYMEKKEQAGDDPAKMPPFDPRNEAVIPALKGEIPLKIHCCAGDILTAIDIARQFGCRYTLDHALGCHPYVEEIVEGGGPVILGPFGIMEGWGEIAGDNLDMAAVLDQRGVLVSLMTDGVMNGPQVLLISAGEAVRRGADHMRVLRMITINPAVTLGVEDRVGSLKPGKDADLVVWSAMPALEMAATPLFTVIDGKIVWQKRRFCGN